MFLLTNLNNQSGENHLYSLSSKCSGRWHACSGGSFCFLYFEERHRTEKSSLLCVTRAPLPQTLVFQHLNQVPLPAASFVLTEWWALIWCGQNSTSVVMWKCRFQTPAMSMLQHFIICTGHMARRAPSPRTFHWGSSSPALNDYKFSISGNYTIF